MTTDTPTKSKAQGPSNEQQKQSSRAGRVQTKKTRSPGWLSTDEEEIERRRKRGSEEAITIKALEPAQPFFGSFRTTSGNGSTYNVEIRAIKGHINSCDCPDYQVNRLGTCKHIEAVLLRLTRKSKTTFKSANAEGSQRIEIYLDQMAHKLRILWPQNLTTRSAAYKLFNPFFSNSGELLSNPLDAIPAIEREAAQAHTSVRSRLRISAHIAPWLARRQQQHLRQQARAAFTKDVGEGKRSLDVVKTPLFPYQQEGMLHLAFCERALLADEMGLGKTVQAVAACELLRRLRGIERVLIISPASLKTEWEEQIGKFTGLSSQIIFGNRSARQKLYRKPAFFNLCNYEQVLSDGDLIQNTLAPDVIILDEAQRIKNWQTKTATKVKRLHSQYAFVLTGTPLENRIDEVYSIVQFLDPHIFGPLFRFNRDFYQLDERGRPTGYKNLDELHRRLEPVMLRRRKEDVEGELPGRTIKNFYVAMDPEQSSRYEEFQEQVAKIVSIAQRRPLTPDEFEKLQKFLACMRMVCDTPYILDSTCRVAPKLDELEKILIDVLEEYERKIVIFSEWTRMLDLVQELLHKMELDYALHTGAVAQRKRREEINRFKKDPDCRLFLSSESGSTGLNLQNASVVINMDLPWNPARLEQRIARAWRKHQTRSVQVINLVCENSIEHRMLYMLDRKQALADNVIDGIGEMDFMEIPSGRQAMIERIEGLMGRAMKKDFTGGAAQAADTEADRFDRLRQDTVSRLSDRLDTLQVFSSPQNQDQNQGQKPSTLIAVVDRADDTARDVINQAAQKQTPDVQLELLDRATYETIQRLIAAGVLKMNSENAQILHQSAQQSEQKQAQQKRLMAEAQRRIAAAERQRRMAGVLLSGGFAIEALNPLENAVETGLAALAHALGEENSAEIPLAFIETRLVTSGLVPAQTGTLIAELRDKQPRDEQHATNLYERCIKMLDHANEALDKAALNI